MTHVTLVQAFSLTCKTGIKNKKFPLCTFVRIHVNQLGQCLAHSRNYLSASKTKPTWKLKAGWKILYKKKGSVLLQASLKSLNTTTFHIYKGSFLAVTSGESKQSYRTAVFPTRCHSSMALLAPALGSSFSSSIPAINMARSWGKQLEFYNTRQSFIRCQDFHQTGLPQRTK